MNMLNEKTEIREKYLTNKISVSNFAAINNELIRLIYASYKERYFIESDDISFYIVSDVGNGTHINSLESALCVVYDVRIKNSFRISVKTDKKERQLICTKDFFDVLLPYIKRAFPQLTIEAERWENWLAVSNHAVDNEALSIADKITLDAKIAPYGSLLDYASGLPSNENFAFFCRYAAYFGRFDMPFSKMKLPVSNKDALRYAPEFGLEIPVLLAAVHCTHMVTNSCDRLTINELIQSEYPIAYACWEQAVSSNGKAIDQYIVLPVHPLSLPLFESRLHRLIEKGELILDTGAVIPTKAGLSYRTMIPTGDVSALSIKLSVPLQLTGYVRYIDIEELRFAPKLSNLLANIFDNEANFGGRLRLDRELVTAWIAPQSDSTWVPGDAQYFSCLIRQNQSRSLPHGNITMPLAGLFCASSIGGKPVLIEAMERAGIESQELAISYFNNYIDMILSSVLRMYLRHGVMLEAHQQNMGVSFDSDGRVNMLHYHDIACAVFFYRPVFIAAGNLGSALQGISHPYASDDIKNSCTQFVHTVLLLNIIPVIDMITNFYDIQKEKLLRHTYSAITVILNEEKQLKKYYSKEIKEVFFKFYADFEQHIFASPTFSSKRLLGRLLQQSQTKYWGEIPNFDPEFLAVKGSVVSIENPLHDFHVDVLSDLQTN